MEILSSGPYGPGVLNFYKAHQCLNEKMRKLLVDAFLHYCSSNNVCVTKSVCQSLSLEIKETFQGEIAVSWTFILSYNSIYLHLWIFIIRSITTQIGQMPHLWVGCTTNFTTGRIAFELPREVLDQIPRSKKGLKESSTNQTTNKTTFVL